MSETASSSKQADVRWTVARANAILALRYCILSGRFKDFWERRTATPPNAHLTMMPCTQRRVTNPSGGGTKRRGYEPGRGCRMRRQETDGMDVEEPQSPCAGRRRPRGPGRRNSTYVHIGRLPNPENDAADMAAVLRRLGFEVTTELDAIPSPPPFSPRCHTAALDRVVGPELRPPAMAGCSTVVVDLDPQASAMKWSALRTADTSVETSAHGARLTSVGRSAGAAEEEAARG